MLKLQAYRAERWRHVRLLDVYEEVERAAAKSEAWGFGSVLLELSDLKGDFGATWSSEAAAREFHTLVDRAFSDREDDFGGVLHQWADPSQPGGLGSFESQA